MAEKQLWIGDAGVLVRRFLVATCTVSETLVHAQPCPSFLRPSCLLPAMLLCPRSFPGKNAGVVCRFLLRGIFLTQGSNPRLLHQQVDSLPLSHLGSHLHCQ